MRNRPSINPQRQVFSSSEITQNSGKQPTGECSLPLEGPGEVQKPDFNLRIVEVTEVEMEMTIGAQTSPTPPKEGLSMMELSVIAYYLERIRAGIRTIYRFLSTECTPPLEGPGEV